VLASRRSAPSHNKNKQRLFTAYSQNLARPTL
jgi:hypothetical protein